MTGPLQRIAFALALSAAACCCGLAAITQAVRSHPLAAPAVSASPTPVPAQVTDPGDGRSDETVQILRSARIPTADPLDLARRLGGLTLSSPPGTPTPAAPLRTGMAQRFWITDENDEQISVRAVLREITEHAYFWIHDEVAVDPDELRALAREFEDQIYPTTRRFFGEEPSPGVDGDPHIYILYTRRLGGDIAGYFSSADLVHPAIDPYSNGHEMFVFNADTVDLDDPYTYGVLAHEFQHMIHWNVDRDEALWVNEGFSELAVRLNRLDPGGLDYYYLIDTDLQLNDWPDSNFTEPHYGAAYLFLSYLYDRFGPDFASALARSPENDLESLDLLLNELGYSDPQTGRPLSADSLVLDWAVANLLNQDGGPYGYLDPSEYLPAEVTEIIDDCSPAVLPRDVRQYGVDYLRLTCRGRTVLRFEGSRVTQLLPAAAYSGSYAFWSNKGDDADMTLTRQFDLSGLQGPIELSFRAWYDIEQHWDYVYLLASVDGRRWDMLDTPGGTDRNPTGNNYGWGYTGRSPRGEWIEERVDLSAYAGSTVRLRFEYVTDGAVFGEGMLIDDIRLPALDYFSDFESDDGGWQAEGFVRIGNRLPQTFQLALVRLGDGIRVEPVALDSQNVAELQLELGRAEEAVLVVMGTTRYTRQPASYTVHILP